MRTSNIFRRFHFYYLILWAANSFKNKARLTARCSGIWARAFLRKEQGRVYFALEIN